MKLHEFIDYLKGLDQAQDLIMGYGDNIIGVPKIGNNDIGTMLIVHIPIMFRETKERISNTVLVD